MEPLVVRNMLKKGRKIGPYIKYVWVTFNSESRLLVPTLKLKEIGKLANLYLRIIYMSIYVLIAVLNYLYTGNLSRSSNLRK